MHEQMMKSPLPFPQEEQEAARRRQQRENKSNTTTPTKVQENKVNILRFCALNVLPLCSCCESGKAWLCGKAAGFYSEHTNCHSCCCAQKYDGVS